MEREENLIIIKTILLSILTIIISTCIIFFIAVAKADALECSTRFTYGSDIVTGPNSGVNTTFGSITINGVTQNGHYADFNNIQFEAICTDTSNFPAGTYRVGIQGGMTLNNATTTLLKNMSWQSQIRDANNTGVTTSNKNFTITTRYVENPQQSAYYWLYADITLTQATSQIRFVFKPTTSLTTLGSYQVSLESININGTTDGTEGIRSAINDQTDSMIEGFAEAIDGISSIDTRLQGIGSNIGGITSNLNSINQNTTQTNSKLDNIIGRINAQVQQFEDIKNLLGGTPSTISNVNNTPINNLITAEGRLNNLKIEDEVFTEKIQINKITNRQNEEEDLNGFINSCWNILLRVPEIMTLTIAILSIGVIAHLTNRSG